MNYNFHFDTSSLQSVVGGRSALDTQFLSIKDLSGADLFLKSYGYDPENQEDVKKLWYFHRRSYILMIDKLGFDDNEIPEIIKDPKSLQDIRHLLILASEKSAENKYLQKWACAFIRCMHVFVHDESDLFHHFTEDIQNQILAPIHRHISFDGQTGQKELQSFTSGLINIPLYSFEEKPFKTSASTVIKLLAKPDAVALKVFDKLGVRFVTKNVFDCFRVARFLVNENIISYPHIMPDQSSNNVYPLNLFLEVCDEFKNLEVQPSDEVINKVLMERLEGQEDLLFKKDNMFSGSDYRFIKFISRKLIHIKVPGSSEKLSFHYPFEVQIMDQHAYQNVLNGESQHNAYKVRQRMAAKQRLYRD